MNDNEYIEPTEEQEEKAKQAVNEPFSGGIRDTSKYVGSNGLFKNFRDTANRYHRTDPSTGKDISFNKGTKWQSYIDNNITDPEAKRELEQQIAAVLKNNPNQNAKALKFRLRAIEANIRRRFPNSVPKNFDISGAMLDRTMAKTLLKMPKQAPQSPQSQASKSIATQNNQNAQQAPQAQQTQQTKQQLPKAPGYVDNAMRGNTRTQQAKQTMPQAKATQQRGGGYTSWSQPLVDKVIDKFNDAKQRKAEQRSETVSQNTDSTYNPYNPENPIYQQELKDKVIADLKKKILQCKAIMKKYPNDKNIQAAQQKWIDTYNKAIKKREFKIRLVQNGARNGL